MSSAVRDLAEAEFIEPRDIQNAPLPAKPRLEERGYEQFVDNIMEPLVVSEALGNARAEWTLRHVLNAGKSNIFKNEIFKNKDGKKIVVPQRKFKVT